MNTIFEVIISLIRSNVTSSFKPYQQFLNLATLNLYLYF